MLTISATASFHLDAWCHSFALGQLQLWELPPSIRAWYFLGELHGRASRDPEILELEHTINFWWAKANLKPSEQKDRVLKRLDSWINEDPEKSWDRVLEALQNVEQLAGAVKVAKELPDDRIRTIYSDEKRLHVDDKIHHPANVA